jgi:phosphoserine phosphatase
MGPDAIEAATFYSDSANDLPLLRAVRRAVAVDPDPTLRGQAEKKGWAILALPRTGTP